MAFEDNQLLFGADKASRIVAIELGETGTVRVYRREKMGNTTVDVEPFHPFVWTDGDITDLGLENAQKLAGDLKYNWLVVVDSWKELIALRNGLKKAGRNFFGLSDPVQHYLSATGRTLFKQLPFEELKRMQLEVLSPTGENDLAEASQNPIASIALSDNSGWEQLIVVDPVKREESEHDALKQLTAIIKERDPDVIEGHNLFRFDGRHFVDTFLLAQFYDVGMRSLSGFDRVDVARHFGFCDKAALSALTGKELQRAYLDGDDKFRQRAFCTVRETRAVAELLSPSYFIQAQIFPYNYQDVIVRGNATRINALFLREYFRQRHSIPEMPMVRAFEGGYTDIFFTGVARNVWHCDVASLYPSIMLQFDCFPATDQLQIFRHLLTDLRTFRLEAKSKMRADKDPAKQHHLQALQNTFKILLNSFYGYLGFTQGHFADFDAAARVTQIGRDLLKKMIDWLNAQGAQVIEVDTDGIYFVPPNKIDIDELQTGLAKELPVGIDIEFDEQFGAMFSYKAKNYALLTKDGDVIIKGGALKSRGLEKFQRIFLEEMIKLIMEGKPEAIADLRNEFERKIRNREWKIDMLMKTDTLQDSLEKYRAKIAGSARNRAAAYELALGSGRNYKPGNQISYYIKATPKKVPAYEAARLAGEFDPQNRDENVDYYIAKLDELAKKFASIIPAAEQETLKL